MVLVQIRGTPFKSLYNIIGIMPDCYSGHRGSNPRGDVGASGAIGSARSLYGRGCRFESYLAHKNPSHNGIALGS